MSRRRDYNKTYRSNSNYNSNNTGVYHLNEFTQNIRSNNTKEAIYHLKQALNNLHILNVRSQAVNVIKDSYVSNTEQVKEILNTLETYIKNGTDSTCYIIACKRYMELPNGTESALSYFYKSIDKLNKYESRNSNLRNKKSSIIANVIYDIVISNNTSLQQVKGLLEALKKAGFKHSSIYVAVFAKFIKSNENLQSNQNLEAFNYFKEALKLNQDNKRIQKTIFNIIKRPNIGINIVNQIVKYNKKADSQFYTIAFAKSIRLGSWKEALTYLKEAINKGNNKDLNFTESTICSIISDNTVSKEQVDNIFKLLTKIKFTSEKSLVSGFRKYLELGFIQESLHLLNDVIKLRNNKIINNNSSRNISYIQDDSNNKKLENTISNAINDNRVTIKQVISIMNVVKDKMRYLVCYLAAYKRCIYALNDKSLNLNNSIALKSTAFQYWKQMTKLASNSWNDRNAIESLTIPIAKPPALLEESYCFTFT